MNRTYLLAVVTLLTTPVLAADETENIEGWQVIARTTEGAALNPTCIMLSPNGPVRLRVENVQSEKAADRGAGSVTVIFSDRVIDAKTQAVEGLTFNVTSRSKWGPVAGEWKEYQTGGYVSAVVTDNVDTMLRPIVQGSQISFDLNDQAHSVSLKGSSKATFAFERCLQKVKLAQ